MKKILFYREDEWTLKVLFLNLLKSGSLYFDGYNFTVIDDEMIPNVDNFKQFKYRIKKNLEITGYFGSNESYTIDFSDGYSMRIFIKPKINGELYQCMQVEKRR